MNMRVSFLMVLLVVLFGTALHAQSPNEEAPKEPRTFEMTEGDTTYVMKRYVMVFLMRGESAFDYTDKELEELQAGHMANMDKMAESGILQVAGPFGDDTEFRGILIMDSETVEDAKALVEQDPAIKAGRLKAEYHTWWGAVGTTLK